ncbi:MAG TPA: hypothetical protein EYP14_02965 [Planctomycetaceae bacterium]|nr:hypothetical protein [Planctomycetaceae bacterium]
MPWTHFRPTPEQIAEACRRIREQWDEETHRRRWVRPVREYWTPPVVSMTVQRSDGHDPWQQHCPLSELSG